MKNKTLKISGKITYSIKTKYKWLTEPGACKKCLSMHGNLYDKDDVPSKPHPNYLGIQAFAKTQRFRSHGAFLSVSPA